MSDANVDDVNTQSNVSPLMIEEPSSENSGEKRKHTSDVWNHFTYICDKGLAKCNYCKKNMAGKASAGTSHLKKHLTLKHPYVFATKKENINQMLLSMGDKKMDGSMDIKAFKFDQERSRRDLAHIIILHEYPFSIVDHSGSREYSKNLQPLFRMVTRNTIKKDCLKIFEEEKEKLYAVLDVLPCRVSLTSDMWTSIQNKSYFALTCHYIDDGWKLQKRILNFFPVRAPHTAFALSKMIIEKLYKWNLDRKLMCIALDNCSTNDAMVRDLIMKLGSKLLANGDLFHVRCSAHIVNLVVQEGIDIIKDVLTKVRDSVKYVKSSTLRLQTFKEASSQMKAPNKNVVLDVLTRWNSTYLILQTALDFKKAFHRLTEVDTNFKVAPTDDEWNNAKLVCDCLRFFYDVTNAFSKTLYPSANYYFSHICEVHLKLKTMCASPTSFISEMGIKMMAKFSKYWHARSLVLCVASILDPRDKLLLVEYYMKQIYGDIEGDKKTNEVLEYLNFLHSEYHLKSTDAMYFPSLDDSSSSFKEKDSDSELAERLGNLRKYVATKTASQVRKTDLEMYLEEKVFLDQGNFDILAWWRFAGPKFPTLSLIVRDILTILVSTVASEATFSTSGRVLDQYRSSMLLSTVEAIVCTQNWIRNKIQEQNVNEQHLGTISKEVDDGYEIEATEAIDIMALGEDD